MILSLYRFVDDVFSISSSIEVTPEDIVESQILVLGDDLENVDHKFFQLGYSEKHEQALWVSYKMTKEQLLRPNVDRTDYFTMDPNVTTGSSHHRDYTGSGYSRGHLAPAADMAYLEAAMVSTFYMSNISPQLSAFNGGIWRELEELCRDWTYDYAEVYIVTGPLFKGDEIKTIGRTSEVSIPTHFYKAILSKDWDAIGFIIPHRLCTEPIMDFAVSIDSLEAISGLEIFDEILTDEIEMVAESVIDSELWRVDNKRYGTRINKWNNR